MESSGLFLPVKGRVKRVCLNERCVSVTATNDIVLPKNAPEKLVALVNKLNLEAETFGDSMSSTFDILENILSATTEEEIFNAANAGTNSGQDFVDIPFRIREDGISARKSRKNDSGQGFPIYLQLNVVRLDTNEPIVISIGGLSAVATLAALRDNGVLASYEDLNGMALVFKEKQATNGNVLLVQPWAAGNSRNGSSKK